MIIQNNTVFFKNASDSGVSNSVFNAASDVLSIQVDGDFASGTFFIEGRNSARGEWYPLAAVDLSNFTLYKNGLTQPGLYEFGVVSIREVRARIDAIEGGAVTISGQFISTEET